MPYKDPEAQKRFQREWVAKRRADFLEGKTCEQCGSTEKLLVCILANRKGLFSGSEARRQELLIGGKILCWLCRYPGDWPRGTHVVTRTMTKRGWTTATMLRRKKIWEEFAKSKEKRNEEVHPVDLPD